MLCWILVNRDGFSKRKLGSKDTGDDVFNTSLVYLAQFKVLKKLYLKLSVYNGTLTDDPLSVCAFLCTLLVKIFSKFTLSLYFHHVALFPCCILFMFCYFQCTLFPCCTLFMLHFFHIVFFSCCTFCVLHSFHMALSSCCTVISNFFLRTDFLQKTLEQLPLFHVLCKPYNLEILLNDLLPDSSIC